MSSNKQKVAQVSASASAVSKNIFLYETFVLLEVVFIFMKSLVKLLS